MEKKECKCGCPNNDFIISVIAGLNEDHAQTLRKMENVKEYLFRISNMLIREDYPEGLYHLGRVTEDLIAYLENTHISYLEDEEDNDE